MALFYKNIFAVLIGIITALIIGEIIINLFVQLPERTYRHMFTEDKFLGYKLKPKFSGKTADVDIFIDKNGFRTDVKEKTYYNHDIITIGDSMVFGHLIAYEDTFQSRLEQKTGYKILNAGTSGYNLNQSYNLLESYLSNKKNIFSILGIDVGSDLRNQIDEGVDHLQVYKGRLYSSNPRNSFINRSRAYLSEVSDLYYWVIEVNLKKFYNIIKKLAKNDSFELSRFDITDNEAEYEKKKILITEYIRRYKALTNNKIIIMLIPSVYDMGSISRNNTYNITLEILKTEKVSFIDLRQHFENSGYKYEKLILANNDWHWNEIAHELVSEILYDKITN